MFATMNDKFKKLEIQKFLGPVPSLGLVRPSYHTDDMSKFKCRPNAYKHFKLLMAILE